MSDYSTGDVISLHLDGYEVPDEGKAPYEVSVPGIGEVLGLGEEKMAERIELLSAISNLKEDGFVEESIRLVEGLNDRRKVYSLTSEGEEHASKVRERAEDEVFRVRRDSSEEELNADDLDKIFDEKSLVKALSSMNDDGVIYLGEGVEEAFVNRDEELERFRSVFDSASSENHIFISGEPGVGKTSLVSEIRSEYSEENLEWLVGKSRFEASEPYEPFREAFEDQPDLIDILFDVERPEVDDEEVFEGQRKTVFSDVGDFLSNHSSSQNGASGVVVFIDDLHSADSATVDLFTYLVNNPSDSVYFVGTFRGGNISEHHPVVEMLEDGIDDPNLVELGSFGFDETRELIEQIVGDRGVPGDFVEMVYERTGGNPLFVEESVKHMMESGSVEPEYDIYPEPDSELPIPDEVRDTIDIRLNALDETGMDLLYRGAVIGAKIPFKILVEVSDLTVPEIRDYVDLLVGARIWDTEDGSIRFVSDVIHETLLDRIDTDEERKIHGEVADAMIDLYTEDELRDHHETVAYHFNEADKPEKALEHYLSAAERARSVYATEVAVDNYEEALGIARQLEGKAELSENPESIIEEIGHTYYLGGQYDEANRYFEYLWERSDDDKTLIRIARYQARMKANRGEHDEAIEIADRGLSRWDGETPTKEVCRLLSAKGWAKQQQGDNPEAKEIYEREHEIAKGLGDKELVGWALHDLGSVYMYMGEDGKSEETLRESIEMLEKTESRHLLSRSINNLGIIHWRKGDLHKSRDTFKRSLELDEETGNRVSMSTTLLNLGVMSYVMGESDKAIEYYERSLEAAEDTGNRGTVATLTANIGEVYLSKGELDKALEYYERSLELSQELGVKRTEVHTWSGLAYYYYTAYELDKAIEHATRALEIAEEINADNEKTFVLEWLSKAKREKGELEEAIETQEEALELAEDAEERNKVDTRIALAESYLMDDRVEDAYETVKEAAGIADDMTDIHRKLSSEKTMGMVHRKKGEYGIAEEELESALERAREIGAKIKESETLYELGLMEKERGNEDEAKKRFEEAERVAEKHGLERIRQMIDETDLCTCE